jgi:magnesium-transporting ATPase (P-type)
LDKKIELEKKGIEHLSHHSIPTPVVLSGTKVLTGTGSMVVINVGKNSAIGKIQEIITSGEDDLTPLQLKLEGIARDIGYFGVASSIIIFVVMVLRALITGGKEDWAKGSKIYLLQILDAFIIAITVLVVAIPEGLPLAVTLSLAFSVNKMMLD